MAKGLIWIVVIIIVVAIGIFVLSPQKQVEVEQEEVPTEPSVTVSAQGLSDGTVTISDVVATESSWMVIHADSGTGTPGEVIGWAPVPVGSNNNVVVSVNEPKVTSTLFAMLHVDAGTAGEYEFPGDDAPTKLGEEIVVKSFIVSGLEEAPTEEPAEMLPAVKEFSVTAKRWEFDPAVITVNQGDTVKLTVESIDVSHGFAISQFGINRYLTPGKTQEVEFVADKTGTFSFFCTVPCGSGHSSMRGTLIVEP